MQSKPIVIGPLDPKARASLLARFNETSDAETRLRCQVAWMSSELGLMVSAIAVLVLRSHDTVLRVVKRYHAGGLEAVPRRRPPGRPRKITPEWEAELGRIIELDPRTVGVKSANWTLQLLTDYLTGQTQVAVDLETTRRHLRRLDYVLKRPNHTVQHKAMERPDYEGKDYGWRSS